MHAWVTDQLMEFCAMLLLTRQPQKNEEQNFTPLGSRLHVEVLNANLPWTGNFQRPRACCRLPISSNFKTHRTLQIALLVLTTCNAFCVLLGC